MLDHWISRDWSNKHVAYSTVDDITEYIEIYIMVFLNPLSPKGCPIGPYLSMSKQNILPVEPLIQCEAGRAKTMQRQSLYSPRTPKWPPSDKGELTSKIVWR